MTKVETRLRKRIAELEAMVAMAESPSLDKWPFGIILPWIKARKKICAKLDREAERLRAKEEGGAR